MQFQLLLTATFDGDGNYTMKADTNLPDDASVRKILTDALALMDTPPEEEENTSTYTALSDPENVKMVAASDGDLAAGIHWPDPDARPTY